MHFLCRVSKNTIMKQFDPAKIRSRVYVCILYPEDTSQEHAIQILTNGTYQAVGILHDQDIQLDDSTGEVKLDQETGQPALKKPHFHFVLRFKNAKYLMALARELSIEPNYLRPSSDFRAACRYLIHLDNPEKFQYSPDALIGSLAAQALEALDDTTEDQKALQILDLIEDSDYLSTAQLIRLCAKQGRWSTLRRGGSWFINALHEHNDLICRNDPKD